MLCLQEDHNWKYSNGFRRCKYCGRTEANLRGPIEVAEIKPYSYGRSGKPTKVIAFVCGLFLLLFMIVVVALGLAVAFSIFGG
jgi:hypothetical protein